MVYICQIFIHLIAKLHSKLEIKIFMFDRKYLKTMAESFRAVIIKSYEDICTPRTQHNV